jgi:hypothetical protein
MRMNLRKINQLIREAWQRGQREALHGAGKSSCYSWSYQAARDFFPDIDPQVAARVAQGKARLHWDDQKREVIVVSTGAPDTEQEVDEVSETPIAAHVHLSLQRPDGRLSEITTALNGVTQDMLEAAEDLLQTLITGERPPPKGLYDLCASAFGMPRDEAKERLLAAAYGQGKAAFDVRKQRS